MIDTVKLLIEIPKDSYIAACNESMLPQDVTNVVKAIKGAQPLYGNATNGNVFMTLFPGTESEIEGNHVTVWLDEHRWLAPDYSWWFAKYGKEV